MSLKEKYIKYFRKLNYFGKIFINISVGIRKLAISINQPPPDLIVNDDNLTDKASEYLTAEEPKVGNRVFVLISIFFTLFMCWATFAELNQVVRAEGEIIPPSKVQLVQNRLPGSVRAIEVALGDVVAKGDILFRLEGEDANANFDDNEITRLTAIAAMHRLEAEISGDESLNFPERLGLAAPEAVARESELFYKRSNSRQIRLKSVERAIREHEAEYSMASEQAKNFREEINILTPLVQDGLEPKLKLLDAKNRLAQLSGSARLAEIAAERKRDEYDSINAEFRSQAAEEMVEVRKIAEKAAVKEEAYRAKVASSEVRAPVNGVISSVNVSTVGEVVQGGTSLAEIVPDEQFILVRARLAVEDVSNVQIGQAVQVALSAYDVSRYGSLEGAIERISQNTTVENERAPYYETIISIPQPKFSKSKQDVQMFPGMTVTVDIIGEKRSILEYLLTPIERASGIVFRES